MITLNKEDAFTIVDIISKAQEIVRCKDCKYWVCKEVEGHIDEHYCGLLAEDMYADDFCSRGERK